MADDDPTSALDQIKETVTACLDPRTGPNEMLMRTMAREASAAVAAVEAVLKTHQPGRFTIFGHLCKLHKAHRDFSITSTEADGVRACPDCTATVYASCAGCGPQVSAAACPVREVITRELAKGKGGTDGS